MEQAIIIGSGPAGLTAAIYLARADIQPLIIAGGEPGGQLMTTTEVENFPGYENGILGPELIEKMTKQAERFGSKIIYENVTSVDFKSKPLKVSTDGKTYEAKAVIVATGAYPRKLGLESEQTFWGKGVSSCATCDGAFYKGKIVAVTGGGDSAMEEATFLTRFASKVYIIHRRDEFRASKIMLERAKKNPKIEFILNTEIKEILGDQKVKSLKLFNKQTNEEKILELDGLFLAIGHIPATEIFKNQLETNEKGYLVMKNRTQSNVEGVFIAGDVEDFHYRQAITAAGSGCKAALDVEKYLSSL